MKIIILTIIFGIFAFNFCIEISANDNIKKNTIYYRKSNKSLFVSFDNGKKWIPNIDLSDRRKFQTIYFQKANMTKYISYNGGQDWYLYFENKENDFKSNSLQNCIYTDDISITEVFNDFEIYDINGNNVSVNKSFSSFTKEQIISNCKQILLSGIYFIKCKSNTKQCFFSISILK